MASLFDFNSIIRAPLNVATGVANAAKARATASQAAGRATASQARATATPYVNQAAQQSSQGQQNAYNAYNTASSYSQPTWTDPGIVGDGGLGGNNGSTGNSSGGNSSGGGGTPAARPAPPVKPVPPPPPPKPNYGAMADPYADKYGDALGNADDATASYAAAARAINNRLTHTTDENREGLTNAYAVALQRAGNTLAARDLYRTGLIGTDIAEPDPATVAPETETIIIPDAKSDSLYKRQSTDLAQQLADFTGEQDLANTQYDNQYADVLRKMGWNDKDKAWNADPTSGAYGESTTDNLDDFVGRGLGYSGLLAQGQAQIDKKFNEQRGDVARQAQDFDDTQGRARASYKNKNSQAIAQALEDAISRITQQYGVDRSQVKVGQDNKITREKA